jgi:S-adenosylmethionine/arginine decarboxylase-like enzyme
VSIVREFITRWAFQSDTAKVKEFNSALDATKKHADTTEAAVEKTGNAVKSLQDRFDETRGSMRLFGFDAYDLAQGVKEAGMKLTMALTVPIIGAGAFAIHQAGELEKVESRFAVIFGKNAATMKKWADDTGESLGRGQSTLMSYLARAQDLFVPIGFTAKAGEELSKRLTTLTVDLASFYNMTDDEALELLMGAMIGITRNARRFGVVMNDLTLNQTSRIMGYKKEFKELSEVEKIQVRFQMILRGTTFAQGAAARDADKFKDAMKRLKEMVSDVGEEFGLILFPEIKKALTYLTNLAKTIRDLTPEQKENIVQWVKWVAVVGPAVWLIGSMGTGLINLIAMYRVATGAAFAFGATQTGVTGAVKLATSTMKIQAVELGLLRTAMLGVFAAIDIYIIGKLLEQLKAARDLRKELEAGEKREVRDTERDRLIKMRSGKEKELAKAINEKRISDVAYLEKSIKHIDDALARVGIILHQPQSKGEAEEKAKPFKVGGGGGGTTEAEGIKDEGPYSSMPSGFGEEGIQVLSPIINVPKSGPVIVQSSGAKTIHASVTITVSGSQDPEATAEAVAQSQRRFYHQLLAEKP